ncbi:YjgN family protein [Deinococcus petrolearius]|uniref:YjgN family protein n=1 Tax=Deinococcus petrolearius TaxID=1751295 RepID=A0ABW1DG64_9DEIO
MSDLSGPTPMDPTKTGPHTGSAPEPLPTPTDPQIQVFPVRFTGQAGEYFRLWLVNLALSVVTLGLYLPWARVRTRQYFYGHTWVDGHNFEYTADPWALLRGYLLVGAFFGAYSAATQLQFSGWEWVAGGVALLFFVAYPWMVRQSLRFLARSTVHRGLGFGFGGSLGGAYVAYGAANVAAALSFGLALPWAWFMQRRYQAAGLRYGAAPGHFRGGPGGLYLIGLTALGLALGGGALLGGLSFGLAGVLGLWDTGPSGADDAGDILAAPSVLTGLVVTYVGALALYGTVWQYVRAATLRYVLNHLELGGVVRARATFSTARLVWIEVSNAAAQLVSLGLLTPWAAVRRARYVAAHTQLLSLVDLGTFQAGQATRESALGEAATELLDIDLGF